jgi:hypothetical protein
VVVDDARDLSKRLVLHLVRQLDAVDLVPHTSRVLVQPVSSRVGLVAIGRRNKVRNEVDDARREAGLRH